MTVTRPPRRGPFRKGPARRPAQGGPFPVLLPWSARKVLAAASNAQYATEAHGLDTWYSRSDGTNVFVAHSSDEGNTYAAEVNVAVSDTTLLDQPLIYDATDTTGGAQGRLHLFYGRQIDNAGLPALLLHRTSDDKGATWSAEQTVDTGASRSNNRFYRIAVAAVGGIVNLVETSESNSTFTTDGLYQYRSTDGGTTWSAPTQIFVASTTNPLRPFARAEGGRIHICWYDTLTNAANGGGAVFYAQSPDNGVTWGAPIQTAATTFGRPALDVDNGIVNIVTMSPFGTGISSDVWAIRSVDNGATFGAPVQLVTHTGASWGFSHPNVRSWGLNVVAVWTDVQTPALMSIISKDGGATWGAPQVVFNYAAATGSSDAPWITITTNYVQAMGWDAADNNAYVSKLPLFAMLPGANTSYVDRFNRADENALSDGGKWTTGVTTATGLLLTGQTIERQGPFATFTRDGSYRNDILVPANGSAELYVTIISSTGSAVDAYLIDPATKTGYGMISQDAVFTLATKLAKLSPGETDLALDNGSGSLPGDVICFQRSATEVVAWRIRNGVVTEFARAVDVTFTGAMRLALESAGINGFAVLDDFGGGILTAPWVVTGATPTATGTIGVGNILSAATGTWEMSPTRYGYQWQSSPDGTTWTNITGATLPFFTVADPNKYYRVNITATNAIGSTTQASNVLTPAVLVGSGSVTVAFSPSAAEAIVDQASVQATAAAAGAEAIVDQATVQAVVAAAGSESFAEQATNAVAITPAGVETIIDQAADLATLTPSGTGSVSGGGISDAGTVTATLSPAVSGETIIDQAAVQATLTTAATEAIADAATVTATMGPGAALEAVADQGAAQAAVTPSGAESVAEAASVAAAAAVTGSETLLEANTVQAAATATGAETIIDQATDTATFTPTGVAPGSDAGTATITFGPAGSEITIDQGSATVTITPAAAETIVDQAATTLTFAPSGTDAPVDQGTVTVTFAPAGAEARADQGATASTVTPVGGEQLGDSATVQLVYTAAGQETIRDAATDTATMTATGFSGSVASDSGTAVLTVTPVGIGTVVAIAWGKASGAITRGPVAAGTTVSIPRVQGAVTRG